ncbi:hypothetical protein [Saccharothrix lopnurensis]|uniref:Major capsid protein n=1 Tax=Saccharothrix lopnurensis TaxID=1670621 RepID=A0ABW1P681_9PSEU
MAITVQKATKIARTALGLLEREIIVTNLVWRDAGGEFAGAQGDTITLRVPARLKARKRALRTARPSASEGDGIVQMDGLNETKVDVSLDTVVYSAVPVTDEELTLDVTDFSGQVVQPQLRGVVEGVEEELIAEMVGATYATTITLDETTPRKTLNAARKALDNAKVPATDRYVLMGSDVEEIFLNDEKLTQVDTSGWSETLREAVIGRLSGFTLFKSIALPADVAIVFHKTAFVLSMQAPKVPQGASAGSSQTYEGMSLRWILDYDFRNAQDRSMVDVFIGTNAVVDGDLSNEKQSLTLTGGPTGGTWTATYSGQTTAGIAHNATTTTVRTTLEALSTVGVGNVAVTGAPGAWVVEFKNALGGANLAQMTASGASLTGGSSPAVAVATTTAGGAATFVRAVKIVRAG